MEYFSLKTDFVACMVGGALGDALGYPVEFSSVGSIQAKYGVDGIQEPPSPALWSDDTQMSQAVVRGLTDAGSDADEEAQARAVSARFVEWYGSPENCRAPGAACLMGASRLKSGVEWREAGGPSSGGCGTVMRSHPYGLWHHGAPIAAAALAASHARMTHRHPGALAASAAIAAAVSRATRELARVDDLIAHALSAAHRYDESTAKLMRWAVEQVEINAPTDVVLDRLRGWNAWEAISAALFCFLKHPDDYVACVRLAANTPGDSDSIASVAGALSGIYLGIGAIPEAWVARLEHRDELIADTVKLWKMRGSP